MSRLSQVTVVRRTGDSETDNRPALSVAFILLPDFTLMAFSGFIEALRHAADDADRSRQVRCHWTVLGASLKPARASCGVEVTPWQPLGDPSAFDYIVVVGGLLRGQERVGPEIVRYIRKAAQEGVVVIGLCTGSFLLARAGLLQKRRCTVSHYHVDDFRAEFPDIEADAGSLFTIDQNVITCAGGGASIDLALHIIATHIDRSAVLKCISQMVIESSREPNHPQNHLNDGACGTDDPVVRRAFLYIVVNINNSISVQQLADHLSLGVRRLERNFRARVGLTPADFIRRIRVEHGKRLLERTRKSVTQVAYDCGFADASHFARACQAVLGVTPRALRTVRMGTGAA